jgi:multicomponent Na+:H+ antiporter subunit A
VQGRAGASTRSTILVEADRWLFLPVMLIAVYVTFRGHNAPGGGFAGGLIAGAGFVLRNLADGHCEVRRRTIEQPITLIGAGLALAVVTGLVPLAAGGSLLESDILVLDVPLVGELKLVSSALFDLGVFFLVLGVVLTVVLQLGGHLDDADDLARLGTTEPANDPGDVG